jgi:hypothetical protein
MKDKGKRRKYIKYLKYLLRHIYFVRKACWAKGLFWQGFIHDWSKFLPQEFVPYAKFFYGQKSPRNSKGYYKPSNTGNGAFELAWLHHIHSNPHHWQYWAIPSDSGGIEIKPMPYKYRLEMLCDWWGASMAQGFGGKCRTWYEANKDKMQLHPKTKKWVEENVSDNFIL